MLRIAGLGGEAFLAIAAIERLFAAAHIAAAAHGDHWVLRKFDLEARFRDLHQVVLGCFRFRREKWRKMEGICVESWPRIGHQLNGQRTERRSGLRRRGERLRDLLLLQRLRRDGVAQAEQRMRDLTGCRAGLVLVVEAEIFRFVFRFQRRRSLIFEALFPMPHGRQNVGRFRRRRFPRSISDHDQG